MGITCRLFRYIPNTNWLHLNISPPVKYLFFHKTDCTRLSDSKLSTDSPSLFSQKIMSKFFTARHALTQSSSYPYRHHASYTFHTGVSHIACHFLPETLSVTRRTGTHSLRSHMPPHASFLFNYSIVSSLVRDYLLQIFHAQLTRRLYPS